MELCASPLNARYRRFCSGHLDVDECFGSFGDCLKFEPDAGSFEVNPPFDPTFMAAVCGHMERLLANASGAMSFAVIVPRRPEDASWSKLTNSRYAVKRIDFEAGAHAYVPGGSTSDRRARRRAPRRRRWCCCRTRRGGVGGRRRARRWMRFEPGSRRD